MALTATAPPEVMNNICKLVRDPLIVKGSVNRPNIYLECEELPKDMIFLSSLLEWLRKLGIVAPSYIQTS